MHIQIFTTGGTIDKVYFDAKSEYQVGPPNVSVILGELHVNLDYDVESLFKKDSLDVTDEDRNEIFHAVFKNKSRHIVITHGTDTMVETAKRLAGISDKTIVLTGALQPAPFRTSDAVFNIGCAITAVQTLSPGVYIVMNGRIFRHDNVRKNLELGRFEEITKKGDHHDKR